MSTEINACEIVENDDGSISYYLADGNPMLRMIAVEDSNGVVRVTKPDLAQGLIQALERAGKRITIARA